MQSLTIAPFSRLLWFATPLPGRHVQLSGQSVKQKATLIFTQKTSHGCETHTRHTVIPHGNTKECTDGREKDDDLAVLGVSQKLFAFFFF